jgi:predicted membrane-bound spermidine synthase
MQVRRPISGAWLLCTVFVCGAAVMAVEFLAVRALAPHFGSDLATWTAVLSITLASIAAGNWLGGSLSTRFRGIASPYCFVLGSSFAIALPALYQQPLLSGLEIADPRIGAPAATTLLFTPALALLAGVPPVAIQQLKRTEEGAGSVAGRVYAVSGIGSIFGTLASGLALLPIFGTAAALRGTAALLGLISALGLASDRRRVALAVAASAVLAAFLPEIGAAPSGILDSKQSAYGLVQVTDTGRERLLWSDGILQTGMGTPVEAQVLRGQMLASLNFIELAPYYRPFSRRALVVGLGGGLYGKMFRAYGILTDSVEIDAVVVELARKHFAFTGPVEIGDGRRVLARLARDGNKYDVIVIDAFSGGGLPFQLFSREAFQLARTILPDSGILCLHVIARPRGEVCAALVRTLRTSFEHVACHRAGAENETQHLYLFAGSSPLRLRLESFLRNSLGYTGNERFEPPVSERILSDDQNPLDALHVEEAREWRKSMKSLMR